MKNSSVLRLLCVFLITALSTCVVTCKQEEPPAPPVALFTYYPADNLIAPVTLTFTNKSTNAESYVWSYGNGQSDTGKDIVLTAKTGGTYTVSLEAKGKGGTKSYSKVITVADPPVVLKTSAGFSYSPSQSLTAPVKITFTNTSKNATSYKWDFGDGTSSADANPTKEFTKTGTYTVKLTATGSSNTDESSTSITVNGSATSPTADFAISPSDEQPAPVKITFTNKSKNATSYKWDFGDGTSSAEVSPIKEFTKAGVYTVKLTATDAKNQTAQKTAVVSVTAPASIPVADWSWSASNLKVTFTNQSKNATSYSWNFNDGSAASTVTNPVHDYAKAGVYTVTLTASNGKTQHQQSKLVTVSASAAANCDWAGWAKLIKVVRWDYTTSAYCKVNTGYDVGSNLEVQNLSAAGMEIYFSLQKPTGAWENQGFIATGSGGIAKATICGKSPGYFLQARPYSASADACPFSKK